MATLRAEANADPDLGDSLALIPDLLSVLAAAGQANLLAIRVAAEVELDLGLDLELVILLVL